MARLLRIGAIAEAYLTPSSLPIFLGAYIIDPGYRIKSASGLL